MDDITVFSPTFDQHLIDLEQTLLRLQEVGLRLNLEKCAFGKQKIKLLGHKITDGKLLMDEDRIKDHMLGYLYGNSVTLAFVVGILLAGCRDYYRELMAIFRGGGNSTAPIEVKAAEGIT